MNSVPSTDPASDQDAREPGGEPGNSGPGGPFPPEVAVCGQCGELVPRLGNRLASHQRTVTCRGSGRTVTS